MLKSLTRDADRSENLESGNVLRDNRKSSTGKLSTKKSKTSKSSSVVAVRLLKNTRYKIKGISGKEYVFPRAGSVLQVNSEDVKILMKKNENRPNSCCGGSPPGKIFELV